MHNIPYSRQDIDEDDIAAVADVLRSDFLTTGPKVAQFEDTVNEYCTSQHAVAVSSATAALHISLLAMQIGQASLVWTSPISFVASSNCALYVGADIDFVDCDPITANIDIAKLEQKLQEAQATGKLPDVLVVVHFSGRVVDMPAISNLAKQYKFRIIEDAAHALGSTYLDGKPVGASQYSDATIFSFHPVKSIATGEGGMVVTNDQQLADKVRLLRNHGVTRDEDAMHDQSQGAWYYEQQLLGYNYRITDIQAALGISQLKKLPQFIEKRRKRAQIYHEQLAPLPIILPPQDDNSAWHIYVVQLPDGLQIDRAELFAKLREANVGVNVHYIPIHTQPYYQELGFKPGDFEQAKRYYSHCLSIPLFPKMTDDEQAYVVEKLKEFLA